MKTTHPQQIQCDVMIIGSGLTGMAAAIFLANRGQKVMISGETGELQFASSYIDLMGVHPIATQTVWDDPWAAISAVQKDLPNHPFSRMKHDDIQNALVEYMAFTQSQGLTYIQFDQKNVHALTPVGTLKPTYAVLKTMSEGIQSFQQQKDCLFIDFKGYKEYSAKLLTETLKPKWPNIRAITIPFPGLSHLNEVYPLQMAQQLLYETNIDALAEVILSHLENAQAIGIPAILGEQSSETLMMTLSNKIGVPVFEIPTPPPAITGLRIKQAITKGLIKKGVRLFEQTLVNQVTPNQDGSFTIDLAHQNCTQITCTKIILATGRFFGKGLKSTRKEIIEPLLNLPVYYPSERNNWHAHAFFDSKGHALNQAGIEINNTFQPINSKGEIVFNNVFVAGSILAHQDWMRMKCGSSLAIATAYGAVKAMI